MTAAPCLACGEAGAQDRIQPLVVTQGDPTRTIPDRRMVCDHGGTISYVGAQISKHALTVAAAVRETDGLLSPDELRRIRARYRLRQVDLEQMLAIGPKIWTSWTSWERGKVAQSKAADTLIPLLGEDPDVARRPIEQAGIDTPEGAAALAGLEAEAKRMGRARLRVEFRQLQGGDMERLADRLVDRAFELGRQMRQRAAERAEAA